MPQLSTLQKLLIALVVIVVLFVGVGVLLTANRNQPEVPQTQIVDDEDSADLANPARQIDFGSSQELELVSAGPLHPFSELLFIGSQVGFQDEDFNLVIGETVLDNAPAVPLKNLYYSPDGNFLLDTLTVPQVLDNTNQIQPLPSDVASMTPYENKYRYLVYNEPRQVFEVRETENILIGRDPELIGSVISSNGFTNTEIRTIAGVSYVFFFSDDYETIEIWQVLEEGTRKIQDLEGVSSFKVFEDFILYTDLLETPTDLTAYKTNYLNLANPEQPFAQKLNWTQALGQANIYGDPSAYRCDYDGVNTLYCLVKQADVPDSFADYRDSLFTYNLETNRLEYLYPTIGFAASRVYVSPEQEVYLNLQGTRELYKFN